MQLAFFLSSFDFFWHKLYFTNGIGVGGGVTAPPPHAALLGVPLRYQMIVSAVLTWSLEILESP